MAIVTFNRTMSIHTLMFAIILVLTSLGIPLLANVSSFENSKNHLNFDHYNVGDNELYDERALIGDGELYKDHEEIRTCLNSDIYLKYWNFILPDLSKNKLCVLVGT